LATILITLFNQAFNQESHSHLTTVYKYFCVSPNKLVLNWAQVRQLLGLLKLKPNCTKLVEYLLAVLHTLKSLFGGKLQNPLRLSNDLSEST
jgi:hypothetical protein